MKKQDNPVAMNFVPLSRQRIEGMQIIHPCDYCHGTGHIHEEWKDYETHEAQVYDGACRKCKGTGQGEIETVTLILPVGMNL